MTGSNQMMLRRLLAGLSIIAVAAPRGVFAADGGKGYLDYLVTDTILLAILLSNIVLLLGFLLRLQRLRTDLSSQVLAMEKDESITRMVSDKLPHIIRFQLECSPSTGFAFRSIGKGFDQIMGLDRERVMSSAKLAFDHLYEADIPALMAAHRTGRDSLEPAELNIRVLDISGNLKWLYLSAVPHHDNGQLIWDGIMQDISDSKQTEASLEEEKRNFQNLFETIDDFMLVCDMSGNLLHTNPSVRQRLGYEESELHSMNLCDLYPEPLRAEAHQIIALMQSEPSATCGLPFQIKSGGTIPVEMNLFQGTWETRKTIFGVARDTTHRRETETALRESEQMLQLIMDTIPMSVFWKNKESVYLGCNETFIKDCGFENLNDVVGKSPLDLFDLETANSLMTHDRQVVSTNTPAFNILLPYSRQDGTAGQREASKIPLHNEDDEAVGVLEIWRDVTEQNLSEERLKRTLEDMERFNQLMRGRERRTLELKDEINALLKELGREIKYHTTSGELL
jgi:PAS domain S-box-containing protein